MLDAYSDVDSVTSTQGGGDREIYDLLVNDVTCKVLGKSRYEMEMIVNRIEKGMGVTKKSILLSIPEYVRLRYGLPARLNKWLSQQPSDPEDCLEMSYVLRIDGLTHGLSNEELLQLIHLVVDQHKITCCLALSELNAQTIEYMITSFRDPANAELRPGVAYYLRHHFLKLRMSMPPSVEICHILRAYSGEDDAWVHNVCKTLGSNYGLVHIENLMRRVAPNELRDIVLLEKFPLATYSILSRFCKDESSNELACHEASEEMCVYVEPTVEELITRVGCHYGHTTEEVMLAKKVIVEENWLTRLDHIRSLDSIYLLQLNLSPEFLKNLISALRDPLLLNMTLCDRSTSMENRIKIREAVDVFVKEIPDDVKLPILQSFIRLFQHLILTPTVKKDNPIFKKSKPYTSKTGLLRALGYLEYDDCFLLPIMYMERTQYAHELLASHCNQLPRENNAQVDLTKYVTSAWDSVRQTIQKPL